jgi:hypothetical protein
VPDIITFNEKTKMMTFINPEERNREKAYHKYPIGELLLAFLEFDFKPYDVARAQLLNRISHEEIANSSISIAIQRLIGQGCVVDLLSPNKDPIDSGLVIRQHEYFENVFISSQQTKPSDASMDILRKADYLSGQKLLQRALGFCLDIEFSDKLVLFSAAERFAIGTQTNAVRLPVDIKSLRAGFITDFIGRSYRLHNDGLNVETLEKWQTDFVDHPMILHEGYISTNPLEMATLELMKMIQMGIMVRRCANCGRYFVIKGDYGTKYCDRIPVGQKRTCQGIGSLNEYKLKVKNSDLLSAYTRAYNRIYNRKKMQGTVSQIQFDAWVKSATTMRDNARDGKISESEAIKWFIEQ